MAYKTLIFGTDDIYDKLKPLYDEQVHLGNLEIVARVDAINESDKICDVDNFDIVIISAHNDFYRRMKLLEAQGIPRNKILDG